MSTFVEVTETVPPPPAATATAAAAAAAPAPDGNAPAAQVTNVATDTAVAAATAAAAAATNTVVAASITASGVDGSQVTGSGGGQAMVQGPGTVAATSTAVSTVQETGTVGAASSTAPGEVQVSGLAGAKTALVSMPAAPSGITTSAIRGKSSPIATSTPSPTSTATSSSSSSTQKLPTYAAGLASGTAIIAAAGAFTAIYIIRRRNRRYRQRRKPSPVNEIGRAKNRPFSIRKVSEVMGMTNLSHKACVGGDGNKLTSMKPPPDIDPETSWPRGYVPPDPEELRESMDDEKRRSGGGREGFDSAVDLGIGYVSSAGSAATPSDKRDGYFDGYAHDKNARPLSEMSMPDHMKHIMTPLNPRHKQEFVPEPVDRAGAVSPAASSIYSRDFSRRQSIVTSFGDIHAKIDGNNNFNPHREHYRLRKEQLGIYDFVEEESPDDWSEPHKGLKESERPEASRVEEYSSPYTAQHSAARPLTGGIGQHDGYFSTQHSTVNLSQTGQITGEMGQHDDYFSTHHSAVNPDNRESQYEDIDLSQNDLYAEETTNSNKRSSGGYFERFFGRVSGKQKGVVIT